MTADFSVLMGGGIVRGIWFFNSSTIRTVLCACSGMLRLNIIDNLRRQGIKVCILCTKQEEGDVFSCFSYCTKHNPPNLSSQPTENVYNWFTIGCKCFIHTICFQCLEDDYKINQSCSSVFFLFVLFCVFAPLADKYKIYWTFNLAQQTRQYFFWPIHPFFPTFKH